MFDNSDRIRFHTVEASREFMEDIQDFIRLNRHHCYEPQLCAKQRIFKLESQNNFNVQQYGAFIELLYRACRLIDNYKMINNDSIIIISNIRIQNSCYYLIDRMGISELDRLLRNQYVKTWITDDDYKDILIFNFGDYEVRTGILTEWNNRSCSHDKEATELTKKYPHKCYKCNKHLNFYELYSANKSMKKEELIDLWKSDYIEFYCCSCYKKEYGDR